MKLILTFLFVLSCAPALLADVAIYLAYTFAQNNELDVQLHAEVIAVAAQLSVADGR